MWSILNTLFLRNKMKIVRNKWFPFGSYYAINICGVVFCKGKLSAKERNHEYIHTLQQRELLYLFFYLAYAIEWGVRLVQYRSLTQSYFNISFEREAYANEHNLRYRRHRSFWAWRNYMVKRTR